MIRDIEGLCQWRKVSRNSIFNPKTVKNHVYSCLDETRIFRRWISASAIVVRFTSVLIVRCVRGTVHNATVNGRVISFSHTACRRSASEQSVICLSFFRTLFFYKRFFFQLTSVHHRWVANLRAKYSARLKKFGKTSDVPRISRCQLECNVARRIL